MTETDPELRRVANSLVRRFPTSAELKTMASDVLGANLDEIAHGTSHWWNAYVLARWAEDRGRLQELIDGAHCNGLDFSLVRFNGIIPDTDSEVSPFPPEDILAEWAKRYEKRLHTGSTGSKAPLPQKPTIADTPKLEMASTGSTDSEAPSPQKPTEIDNPKSKSASSNKAEPLAPPPKKLTGEQIKQIHDALLSGYTLGTLRMMLRMELNIDLATVAGGDNTSIVVFNLIDWAERTGKVTSLIAAAYRHNPGNPLLGATAREFVPSVIDIDSSTHGPSSQELRIRDIEVYETSFLQIEMVKIPAGQFLYGSDKTPLYLDEYLISRTPITNHQYEQFILSTGHHPPDHWKDSRELAFSMNHPVTNVSISIALVFCRWLASKNRELPGIFLPTEQQWEKAARGVDGRAYPWGNADPTPEICNYGGNLMHTTPVGHYSPNSDSPFGLVDAAGNVWEWCGESPVSSHAYEYPLRGGSWFDQPAYCRCDTVWSLGDRGLPNVGFRIVAPVPVMGASGTYWKPTRFKPLRR